MIARENKKLPNKDDLLSCLTSRQIFEKYLGELPTKPIVSPLRDEKQPSFSLFHSDEYNMMMFKDFATDEVGDCFIFVMRLLKHDKITDTFCRIADDFGLYQFETRSGNVGANPTVKRAGILTPRKKKAPTQLLVRRRPWAQQDKSYWKNRYGLGRAKLEYCGVFPISHYFVHDKAYIADRKAYAYVERKDGEITYKVYQPHNNYGKKWVSNNNHSIWELWTQLPARGDICIITASRKDAMVVKDAFPSRKVTAVSLQSEGTYPKGQVMAELVSRFKRVYVLYDKDDKGEKSASKIQDQYAGVRKLSLYKIRGNSSVTIAKGVKDLADIRHKHGQRRLIEVIKTLIINLPHIEEKKPF